MVQGFSAKLDLELVVAEKRMPLVRYRGLQDGEGILELPNPSAHFRDLAMELVGIGKDEPGARSTIVGT